MNGADRLRAVAVFQILWQKRFHWPGIEFLKQPIDEAAQKALRNSFGRRIDRRNPAQVNRFFGVVFDHFKFGMVHAKSLAPKSRLAVNDELLVNGDHFLDVIQIEPAKNERLAERIRVRLLQGRLKNSSTSKAAERRFGYVTGEADRFVT